jgi:hypothetical protein
MKCLEMKCPGKFWTYEGRNGVLRILYNEGLHDLLVSSIILKTVTSRI